MHSKIRKNLKVYQQQKSNMSQDQQFQNFELNPILKNFMIKEAFTMFDADGSGEIDPKEFKKLVISLGIEVDEKKIYALYKEIDTNRSGTIDLQEFTAMMMKYEFSKDSPVEWQLENTFNLYDKNGDGIIDLDDFKKVGDELDYFWPNEDIMVLIKIIKVIAAEKGIKQMHEIDRISKEEFVNVLMKFNFLTEVKKEDLETVENFDREREKSNSNRDRDGFYTNTNSNLLEKKHSSKFLPSRELSKSYKYMRSSSKSPSKSIKSSKS